MKLFSNTSELKDFIAGMIEVNGDDVKVLDEAKLKAEIRTLDDNAVLAENEDVKNAARWLIIEAAQSLGAIPASINDFYFARGRGEFSGITVPAINVRGFSFDFASAIFEVSKKLNNNAVIFEIAKSESGYCKKTPAEFTPSLLAAAIATGYRGPVFIQADHSQFNAKKYKENPEAELAALKAFVKECIDNFYYNIDCDSSTLVDLSQPTVDLQQKNNYEASAELTRYIRSIEPAGVTVSIGGEIGEIGESNSTVEELEAYMDGFIKTLNDPSLVGLSKISVNTGSSHGGVVLEDGSIAEVKLDFDTLAKLSEVAITKYKAGGAVQHGASTLPDEAFDKFPKTETIEVHLATGFQNTIMDSPNFPPDLLEAMYKWMKTDIGNEQKPGMSDGQFYQKLRKKAWGVFKTEVHSLPEATRNALKADVSRHLEFIFRKLNAVDTVDLINKFVKPVRVKMPKPANF